MIAIHRGRGWIRRYWRDLAARDEKRSALSREKVAAIVSFTDELMRLSEPSLVMRSSDGRAWKP